MMSQMQTFFNVSLKEKMFLWFGYTSNLILNQQKLKAKRKKLVMEKQNRQCFRISTEMKFRTAPIEKSLSIFFIDLLTRIYK